MEENDARDFKLVTDICLHLGTMWDLVKISQNRALIKLFKLEYDETGKNLTALTEVLNSYKEKAKDGEMS